MGRPIENRARFLREVCLLVRSEVGEGYPVGVKINSADFMKAGFTEEESMYVIRSLEQFGIDLIEISGGTYEKAVMTGKGTDGSKREAYFLEYAERLKQETTIPIAVTGGFRTKEGMEQALASEGTDMIGLARPLAVDPFIPQKLMTGELETLNLPAVKTGIPAIDKGGMMEIMWFSQQLERIGKGKEAKPDFPPKLSLLKSLWENGTAVLKKRRV